MAPPPADDADLGTLGLHFDVLAAAGDGALALQARQRRRLASLLGHAAETVPRWCALLHGCDPQALALTDLPVSGKADLMRHFDDGVADPAIRLDEVRRFCADPAQAGRRWLDRYWVWESSGSTGQPGVYVQDSGAMAVYDSLEALRRHSVRPLARLFDPLYFSERFALVGAVGGHFASFVGLQRLREAQPWLQHWRSFSILQAAPELVAQLDGFGPTLLATYPTAALMLAEEAAAGRLRCRPHEIWVGGETLTDAARARIEAVFGPVLQSSYGASEFLPIAFECRHRRLHVNADWVILEPVDARHRPVPAGQASHTTLLTNLANRVQPLIRFDIGDSIALGGQACSCGSALPVVTVQGRCDDALVVAGAAGRPVTLLPLALTMVLEEQAGVFDYQLCQTGPAALHLGLGSRSGLDAAGRQRCRQLLADYAAAQGAQGLKIQVGTLRPAPPSRSGKLKRIIAAAG
ncbi:coenzyme F390 synthetase [Burkholderiales bacterium JOSHI_001]|nr:coenzyme F390 synthetase [Burkholderiales bacterium JOSHI_001]